jgi:hypothetical protein
MYTEKRGRAQKIIQSKELHSVHECSDRGQCCKLQLIQTQVLGSSHKYPGNVWPVRPSGLLINQIQAVVLWFSESTSEPRLRHGVLSERSA